MPVQRQSSEPKGIRLGHRLQWLICEREKGQVVGLLNSLLTIQISQPNLGSLGADSGCNCALGKPDWFAWISATVEVGYDSAAIQHPEIVISSVAY
jgi:hypothetical protein